jgi:predicted RNase H-like HicB family nuclease
VSEGKHQPLALEEYVYNAMAKARYQQLEDGTYYADLFLCPGVWAVGETFEECRDALKDALADWLISAYEGREPMLSMAELAWLNPRWHRAGD